MHTMATLLEAVAQHRSGGGILPAVTRVAREVAGPYAHQVDAEARFPAEAFDALREARLLGALVPVELGGLGAPFPELAEACEVLGQRCGSTAMIFAMHQIQVACLVRHGRESPFFRAYLRELCDRQCLIASATTETGVGGDVRTSLCAVAQDPATGTFELRKQAPVISYGQQADDILVTARRSPEAPASDQVLVLVRHADRTLERTVGWDTLGFRGTCSLGFELSASAHVEQILPHPYADISSETMLPVAHTLWSSLWLGIATDAVRRARSFVRAEARRHPGTVPPGAVRLAEVMAELQAFRANVRDGVAEFARLQDDPARRSGLGFAIRMNGLKVAASRLVVEVVSQALAICGIAGYRNDSPYSLGRHLRDAHGAGLMVNNDRIYGNTAQMLLVYKDE
jgi:acyl-CoA dehydrogenase